MDDNWKLDMLEYQKQGELNKVRKAEVWETAIGLQEVDGLKPSNYMLENVKEHIDGKIDINAVESRINNYYKVLNENIEENKENCEEADKVSLRIAELLSNNSFNFNPTELMVIHKKLFDGIFFKAGEIRDYNIKKDEWVLNGDSVIYASFESIKASLNYDFEQEKNFSYQNLSLKESIEHICKFISNIWQIHPFCEGNTRTTAVFLIKYLRTFRFNINNDIFANHSWYFRNSLVRANYKNFEKNVFEDISFLEKFFFNLLTDSNYELKNRFIHIDYKKSDENNYKGKDCTLEEQAIINLITSNPFITQDEIAKRIGKSIRTIKTRMIDMQDKKLISRKNGKRDGEWIVL